MLWSALQYPFQCIQIGMKCLSRNGRDQINVDIPKARLPCHLIGSQELLICMDPAKHGKLIIVCRLQSDTHTVDPCIQIFCRLDRGQGSRIHLYRDLCCFIYLKDASKRCQNIHDLARQKYRRSASAYKYRSYNIVL